MTPNWLFLELLMRFLQEASLLSFYAHKKVIPSIHARLYVHKTKLLEVTACETAHKCYYLCLYLPMNPTMNTQSMGIIINCSLVPSFLRLIKIPNLISWSQFKM
jgi:hypothetical protein